VNQPTGIFTMPASAYHDDPAEQPSLSASIASLICSRSPRHAWAAHPKLNPDFARKAESKFDVGTAAHAILLEARPVEHVIEVVYADSWRTNDAKDRRDAARANGRVPLLEKDADAVVAMLDAAHSQLDAMDLAPMPFTAGKSEQTLIWQEGDVTCRALVDWLRDDFTAIDDYKTTSASADPERWTRTLFTIGADVQTAFYLRGLARVTGEIDTRRELRYFVQETYPPYALSVISLGPDVLAVGESKVKHAIRRWSECMASSEWPGYPARVCYAALPAYEESRWMEREAREEVAA
jgi:hypothetical protein